MTFNVIFIGLKIDRLHVIKCPVYQFARLYDIWTKSLLGNAQFDLSISICWGIVK